MTTAAQHDATVPGLRVRVLGGLDVEGLPDGRLGSRKARTVFKFLVLMHGHRVSVDRLTDALWPEALPSKPNDQVAVLVSRLRSVVGSHRIVFGDGGYRLDLDWLDADELSELTDRALDAARNGHHREAHDRARQALLLARGLLLPGDVDAPWTQGPRAAAERTVARARRVASAAALAIGEVDEAAELTACALDVDLFDEEALRLLMRAELQRGRAGAGLAAYARVRGHLADELGVDPSRETEAVHVELLRELDGVSISMSEQGPNFASTPAAVLVGRQGELARLRQELARASLGRGRLVLVEGEAGIGKTALLDVFGEQDSDGVLWLRGACQPFFGGLPMQSVVDALSVYMSTLSANESAGLLAGERAVLGPLLGLESGQEDPGAMRPDIDTGIQRLIGAFDAVFARLTASRRVALVVDDVHLAAASTSQLLTFLARRRPLMLVVVARRPGDGSTLGAGVTVKLGPLAVYDAVRLFGPERGPALHARTGGNPLFLTQLASVAADGPLPESLVETVLGLAAGLGEAGTTVVSAAVLGVAIDVDLLVDVLRIPPLQLIAHLDVACRAGLLDDTGGGYVFRHALIREALSDNQRSARSALLHREAARVLRNRRVADPLAIAQHAQLGGDREVAAAALDEAAAVASERFDRAVAEDFIDHAIRLSDTPSRRLARARARTMRGHYEAALSDVHAALAGGAGAAALEVGAWAAYFGRHPAEARSYADDGAALAADLAVRASCLAVAGRVRHAAGDLLGAEPCLREAVALAEGPARAAPRVWLGVLCSHQGRPDEALELLRGITRVESGSERTSELLHALLFTAHAFALRGRPLDALEALQRYDVELTRREVPRFAGRASNFRGWILRALGQWERADEANGLATEELGQVNFPETLIASHLDLAASALLRADAGEAEAALLRASQSFTEELTFGWRLALRLKLERARLALLVDRPHEAATGAAEVAEVAERLGVARYATVARLVVARACRRSNELVDLDAVDRDLGSLDTDVGIDAWWVTAEVARDFSVTAWKERALTRVASLARAAGAEDVGLAGAASRLLT